MRRPPLVCLLAMIWFPLVTFDLRPSYAAPEERSAPSLQNPPELFARAELPAPTNWQTVGRSGQVTELVRRWAESSPDAVVQSPSDCLRHETTLPYDDLASALCQALRHSPNDPLLLFLHGRMALAEGDKSSARASFLRVFAAVAGPDGILAPGLGDDDPTGEPRGYAARLLQPSGRRPDAPIRIPAGAIWKSTLLDEAIGQLACFLSAEEIDRELSLRFEESKTSAIDRLVALWRAELHLPFLAAFYDAFRNGNLDASLLAQTFNALTLFAESRFGLPVACHAQLREIVLDAATQFLPHQVVDAHQVPVAGFQLLVAAGAHAAARELALWAAAQPAAKEDRLRDQIAAMLVEVGDHSTGGSQSGPAERVNKRQPRQRQPRHSPPLDLPLRFTDHDDEKFFKLDRLYKDEERRPKALAWATKLLMAEPAERWLDDDYVFGDAVRILKAEGQEESFLKRFEEHTRGQVDAARRLAWRRYLFATRPQRSEQWAEAASAVRELDATAHQVRLDLAAHHIGNQQHAEALSCYSEALSIHPLEALSWISNKKQHLPREWLLEIAGRAADVFAAAPVRRDEWHPPAGVGWAVRDLMLELDAAGRGGEAERLGCTYCRRFPPDRDDELWKMVFTRVSATARRTELPDMAAAGLRSRARVHPEGALRFPGLRGQWRLDNVDFWLAAQLGRVGSAQRVDECLKDYAEVFPEDPHIKEMIFARHVLAIPPSSRNHIELLLSDGSFKPEGSFRPVSDLLITQPVITRQTVDQFELLAAFATAPEDRALVNQRRALAATRAGFLRRARTLWKEWWQSISPAGIAEKTWRNRAVEIEQSFAALITVDQRDIARKVIDRQIAIEEKDTQPQETPDPLLFKMAHSALKAHRRELAVPALRWLSTKAESRFARKTNLAFVDAAAIRFGRALAEAGLFAEGRVFTRFLLSDPLKNGKYVAAAGEIEAELDLKQGIAPAKLHPLLFEKTQMPGTTLVGWSLHAPGDLRPPAGAVRLSPNSQWPAGRFRLRIERDDIVSTRDDTFKEDVAIAAKWVAQSSAGEVTIHCPTKPCWARLVATSVTDSKVEFVSEACLITGSVNQLANPQFLGAAPGPAAHWEAMASPYDLPDRSLWPRTWQWEEDRRITQGKITICADPNLDRVTFRSEAIRASDVLAVTASPTFATRRENQLFLGRSRAAALVDAGLVLPKGV